MDRLEQMGEKVGMVMNAEIEWLGEECTVKKQRTLEIRASKSCFYCTLDLDISFRHLRDDGSAFNKAEIYLLPEEYPAFLNRLRKHHNPLPTNYRQRLVSNPNIVCVYMESKEPPEFFAERLAAALEIIDQLDGRVYMN